MIRKRKNKKVTFDQFKSHGSIKLCARLLDFNDKIVSRSLLNDVIDMLDLSHLIE